MPKIVDADARRQDVAQAVYRIIAAAGLDTVSLREVAAEAELVVGSVRHYFGDVAALRAFAFSNLNQRLVTRVQDALAGVVPSADGTGPEEPADLIPVLMEFLPMNETSALECCARMEFRLASRTDPDLVDIADAGYRESAALIGSIVLQLRPGAARADLVVEAERLLAVLDGLSLHAIVHNTWLDAQTCHDVLGRHLQDLAHV